MDRSISIVLEKREFRLSRDSVSFPYIFCNPPEVVLYDDRTTWSGRVFYVRNIKRVVLRLFWPKLRENRFPSGRQQNVPEHRSQTSTETYHHCLR